MCRINQHCFRFKQVQGPDGKVVFDDNFNKTSTIVVQKDSKETWIEVRSYNNMYRLNIVEREIMKQEITANAEAMGNDINSTGHVQFTASISTAEKLRSNLNPICD